MSKNILTDAQVIDLAIKHGHGIPPLLLRSIAYWESGFDAKAVSSEDARGLMQVLHRFHSDKDLFDPDVNMAIGARLLAGNFYALNHIRSGIEQGAPWRSYAWGSAKLVRRALGGYNMGAGNVMWYDAHPEHQWPDDVQRYANGIYTLWQDKESA